MDGKNSKIIICKNIKLDKGYKDVLSYSESDMLSLCIANQVDHDDHYSFIRSERGVIKTDFSYNNALKCNYMAFQNPDYSNKWFFAFIDRVEYANNNTCKIYYTIDVFSTWYDYWSPNACLVVREHVNDDSVGANTYPEGLEIGEYVVNSYQEIGSFDTAECFIIIGTTWLPNNTPNLPSTQYYGGVFSGVYYMAFNPFTADAKNFILALDGLGRGDSVVTAFMAPKELCPNRTGFTGTIHSNINNDNGTTSPHDFTISGYFIGNTTGAIIINSYDLASPSTLNGYTPKNNKLYCYPYNALMITNNQGSSAEFHYEDFISNTPNFTMAGVLSPGCSIRLYPNNYKKIANTTGNYPGFSYGLVAGKFPICTYQNDSFVNYMTQQSVNHTIGAFGQVLSLGTTILSGGDADIGFGLGGNNGVVSAIGNYMNEVYQHSLVAPQLGGNINSADITYGMGNNLFSVYKMSSKIEYLRMCDDYFTKYGYKINRVKLPNQIGRVYYNFVQIGKGENIGSSDNTTYSVPSTDMELINNIYRAGVTIWHDHTTLGDFSVNNTIVSNT